MSVFKQRCIELRKQDYSLAEIVKITGRPKTSVYFHIRDLPLSKQKLGRIQDANRARLVKITASRKGKSLRSFQKFSTWDTQTVSLVSHLLFDGEIKHFGCVYHNRNKTLLGTVETAMRRVYSYTPKRERNSLTGVWRMSYFNVTLGAYLKLKSEELKKHITRFPKKLRREFLRSFFDDEGCMDFRPERNLRRVRGYQKDVEILKIIQKLLQDFAISSNLRKPNEIVIGGKQNLQTFRKEVGFSPGVRINGNRTNSIWKKHLEKRELLKRALASYKK